jgi:hypothetical protein
MLFYFASLSFRGSNSRQRDLVRARQSDSPRAARRSAAVAVAGGTDVATGPVRSGAKAIRVAKRGGFCPPLETGKARGGGGSLSIRGGGGTRRGEAIESRRRQSSPHVARIPSLRMKLQRDATKQVSVALVPFLFRFKLLQYLLDMHLVSLVEALSLLDYASGWTLS